jgi:hypothetical protein
MTTGRINQVAIHNMALGPGCPGLVLATFRSSGPYTRRRRAVIAHRSVAGLPRSRHGRTPLGRRGPPVRVGPSSETMADVSFARTRPGSPLRGQTPQDSQTSIEIILEPTCSSGLHVPCLGWMLETQRPLSRPTTKLPV